MVVAEVHLGQFLQAQGLVLVAVGCLKFGVKPVRQEALVAVVLEALAPSVVQHRTLKRHVLNDQRLAQVHGKVGYVIQRHAVGINVVNRDVHRVLQIVTECEGHAGQLAAHHVNDTPVGLNPSISLIGCGGLDVQRHEVGSCNQGLGPCLEGLPLGPGDQVRLTLPPLQPLIPGRAANQARRELQRVRQGVDPLGVNLGQAPRENELVCAVKNLLDYLLAALGGQLVHRADLGKSGQLSQAVFAVAAVELAKGGRAEALDALDVVGGVANERLVHRDVLVQEWAEGVFVDELVTDVRHDLRTVLVLAGQGSQVAVARANNQVLFGVLSQPAEDVITLNVVLGYGQGT